MPGILLIAAERNRQIVELKYDAARDIRYKYGELALAALCYAAPENIYINRGDAFVGPWPWTRSEAPFYQTETAKKIRNLAIAGALIAAEIDRLEDL